MQDKVRRNIELAAMCGAGPAALVTIALMTIRPRTVEEAIDFVHAHRDDITEASRVRSGPTRLAELEPELRGAEEIARVVPEASDHEIRGRRVFRDLVGKRSFVQVAAFAIDGVELSRGDADLLEQLGINTQLLDPGIWPINVIRRVAAHADFTHAVTAGVCAMLNPNMAVAPVGAFMQVLDRLEDGIRAGKSVEEMLDLWTSRGERIAGVGRPVLGPDERNAQVHALARQHGCDLGSSFRLAQRVDAHFRRKKRIAINSAGLQGAIMRDMGFTARGASAFCVLYFMVPILAHATFGEIAGKTAGHAPAA